MAFVDFAQTTTNFAKTDWATITLAGLNVVQVVALGWITSGPARARSGRDRRG